MPLHFGVLAVFRAAPGKAPVRLVRERAARVAELRQRVRGGPLGSAVWVDDPEFRVSEHVASHSVRSSELGLTGLVAELMAAPLPPDRPLWRMDVIRGLGDGRWAILARLHHAVSDGPGAVELALRLFDGFPARQGSPSEPWWFLREALTTARQSWGIVANMAIRARPPHPDSPLYGSVPLQRQVEFLRFPLTDLRQVRDLYGGTVNDVLLAMVTGALRGWTRERIRVLIPVDLRPTKPTRTGRNQLSSYLCDLPMAEASPIRRFHSIRSQMNRNKTKGPHRGAGAFPLLADRVPAGLHRAVTPLLTGVAPALFDLAVTNVRLPSIPLTFGGAPLEAVYPVAPFPVGHRMSIAACGYGDSVFVGINGDPELGLDDFGSAMTESLAELADA